MIKNQGINKFSPLETLIFLSVMKKYKVDHKKGQLFLRNFRGESLQ